MVPIDKDSKELNAVPGTIQDDRRRRHARPRGDWGNWDYRDAAFIKPGFGPDWAQQRKAAGMDLDRAFRAVGDSRIRLWNLDEGGMRFPPGDRDLELVSRDGWVGHAPL